MRVAAEVRPGGSGTEVELPPLANGMDLVRALGLSPDAHVLLRGGEPIPEDAPLREGDRITVVGVVSGG